MTVMDLMAILGYTITIFAAGIAVGKYIARTEKDRR